MLQLSWSFLFIVCFLPRRSSVNIPIGVIVESGAEQQIQEVREYFRNIPLWPQQHSIEVKAEVVSSGDLTQIHRAVCRLLEGGAHTIITSVSRRSYQMLVSFSNEFALPFVSQSLPQMPHNSAALYGFSVEPSTTLAIIDVLREYRWNDMVYIYDDKRGVGMLQEMFMRGFRTTNMQLLGIFQASNSASANQYLRRLEEAKNRRSFAVILDTDPILANEILVRHVHDTRVGKKYHFILSKPMSNEFWERGTREFSSLTVTGFLADGQMKSSDGKRIRWSKRQSRINETTSFSMHDAAAVVGNTLLGLVNKRLVIDNRLKWSRNCLQRPPTTFSEGTVLAQLIRQGSSHTVTDIMEYTFKGERKNVALSVVEISDSKLRKLGMWSDERRFEIYNRPQPLAISLRLTKKTYKITSILNPPFMMVQDKVNGTQRVKYSGYCKDLIDVLAKELNFTYEINIVADGKYGYFDKQTGLWTGMIGELLRKDADMVVADLHVTPDRHRVVDFAEPHMTHSLSVLLKNPQVVTSRISPYFFLNVFSSGVWVCVIVSALAVIVLSHVLFILSGEPDNIEAASGIWGKKFTVVSTAWFVLGSGLLQSTAVYPRSVSSRILGACWWCFNLALVALYIAGATTQMFTEGSRTTPGGTPKLDILNSLSLESVLKESVVNNWPHIGVRQNGRTHQHIKHSSLPFLKDYREHLEQNPDIFASSVFEGIERAQASFGEYGVICESLLATHYSRQRPCDLTAVNDVMESFFYGIALPAGSPIRLELNAALEKLRLRGVLSYLREKWFQDGRSCEAYTQHQNGERKSSLYTHSVLLVALTIGFVVAGIATALQYFWKSHRRGGRRQHKLSFDEVAMRQSLPLPPPEMLREPSEAEENGVVEGWAERKLVPTSFGASTNRNSND